MNRCQLSEGTLMIWLKCCHTHQKLYNLVWFLIDPYVNSLEVIHPSILILYINVCIELTLQPNLSLVCGPKFDVLRITNYISLTSLLLRLIGCFSRKLQRHRDLSCTANSFRALPVPDTLRIWYFSITYSINIRYISKLHQYISDYGHKSKMYCWLIQLKKFLWWRRVSRWPKFRLIPPGILACRTPCILCRTWGYWDLYTTYREQTSAARALPSAACAPYF